ncbi:MAG: hypothetical protein ACI965_001362, partial [Paraglaciecola sp.]
MPIIHICLFFMLAAFVNTTVLCHQH